MIYCGFCGLPEEYCKYGPLWDSHPVTVKVGEATSEEVAGGAVKVKSSAGESGSKSSTSSSQIVTVKIALRIGRRYLTTVSGLEAFDVDLNKACRIFAKKFACGVGKKDDSGDIEIQGDVEEQIVSTITSNFKNIRERNVVIKRK